MRAWMLSLGLFACGDNDGLHRYYPELPPATGEAQAAFAGLIRTSDAPELLKGIGATGRPGDYYLRNNAAAFVISAPDRIFSTIPNGGNLIDGALKTTDGYGPDTFGELTMVYKWGRVCEHERVEVVRDGSGGGIAAIRAVGKAAANDFINLRAVPGLIPADDSIDPHYNDRILCATTYVLAPDATHVEVTFSLYNNGYDQVDAPVGVMADPGRQTFTWGTGQGFDKVDFASLTAFTSDASVDFTVYQSDEGTSYGVVPRTGSKSAAIVITGLSFVLFDIAGVTGILEPDKFPMHIPPREGYVMRIDFGVGRDAEDISRLFWAENMVEVAGNVTWSDGMPSGGARVGVYKDADGDGAIGEDDEILSYLDADAGGAFSGRVPTGAVLLRAEQKDQGRSAALAPGANMALVIPKPLRVDYTIADGATNQPTGGRVLVIGNHTAFPDKRVFEVIDRTEAVVAQAHSICGTTVGNGECVDPPLYVPASAEGYRVFVTKGTEWSYDSAPVPGDGDVALELTIDHVVPTPGYVSSDWHVHQTLSWDSTTAAAERIRSAVSGGVDVFAITDHDFITTLQPLVEELGLQSVVRVVTGLETTPFSYGHINGFPLEPDTSIYNGGPIDWPRGSKGYAMLPSEIMAKFRQLGAKVVQVNHPRSLTAFGELLAAFDRANLSFDTVNRVIFGDYENASTPNEWMRLPNQSLWSADFNALEVWNGFSAEDTDGDGQLEISRLDYVLRDWFNMLSFGFVVTPTGNSDTHTSVMDPLGMPRTMVRVADDSPAALAAGTVEASIWSTMTGETPRDIVLTNGPWLDVTHDDTSALGRTLDGTSGVTLQIRVVTPDWADINTVEVFANQIPPVPVRSDVTSLQPLVCFTTRGLGTLADTDPCKTAPLAAQTLSLTASGGKRTGTVTLTLNAADIPSLPGGNGDDAWLVVRARGNRGIFPILTTDITSVLPTILQGNANATATAMDGLGTPALAFTSAIFVDFDGGGYRAPFAP